MAIEKQDNLYGIEIKAYVKMIGNDVREDGEFENGEKKYRCTVILNYYTNESKEYQYKQELEELENLEQSDLTLESIYGKIMRLEKFKNSIFV